MLNQLKNLLIPLCRRQSWETLTRYLGINAHRRNKKINDINSLCWFLNTRASYVSQSTLYGYLRTRAGTRYPELFKNPDIVISINIAKWHIWLACLADLSLFMGQLIYQSGQVSEQALRHIMKTTSEQILDATGAPQEAGSAFVSAQQAVRKLIQTHDWTLVQDGDSLFSRSADALVYWSPIADELKDRDTQIVTNSIRFCWIDIRRQAHRLLMVDDLIKSSALCDKSGNESNTH